MKIIPYLRLYYERSNGKAVLDTGPGTPRTEVTNFHMSGTFTSEHAEGPPKFWLVARKAVVQVMSDVAYVSTLPAE